MVEFKMPSLGADMEAGTLVEWRVKVGDRVRKGDIVAVVETQKGAIEIEVFAEGVIAEIRVREEEKVPVGAVLAVIGAESASEAASTSASPVAPASPSASPSASQAPSASASASASASPSASASASTSAAPAAPAASAASAAPAAPAASEAPAASAPAAPAPHPGSWIRSSPSARQRAHELGVALADVAGTGPHGAVHRGDVERFAAGHAATPAAPPPARAVDARQAMRQAIAAAMSRSNREIPHYYLVRTIDMARATAWLAERNAALPPAERILPIAPLVRATAMALIQHPDLNGTWENGAFKPGNGVNIGMAISLRQGGLVIPAILGADKLGVAETMAAIKDLVARARAGRLRSSELSEGTVTLTSLGEQGADAVYGVIYPPQVALVGFGRVHDAPVAIDGLLGIHPIVIATLAADHRASDGHRGGLLLATIDSLLQEPEKL